MLLEMSSFYYYDTSWWRRLSRKTSYNILTFFSNACHKSTNMLIGTMLIVVFRALKLSGLAATGGTVDCFMRTGQNFAAALVGSFVISYS